jgi:hypothetical protein
MANNSTQSNIIKELQEQLAEQKSANLLLLEELKNLHRQNEILTHHLNTLLRQVYGRKSEKLNLDQLQLFIDSGRDSDIPTLVLPDDETPDYEEAPAQMKKKKRGSHPGRAPLPDHLERE